MSLTKDALELIHTTAIVAAETVVPDHLRNRVTLLPGGGLVDIEQYQLHRQRYRGAFTTHSLADFAEHVTRTREGLSVGHGAGGFVNIQRELSAVVFFNLGTPEQPGHGDWTATLQLRQTPAYAALLGINGRRLSQQQAVEFLEDWHTNVAAFTESEDGQATYAFSRLLSAVRRLSIKRAAQTDSSQAQYAASKSVLESVEASSPDGLPDFLTFHTEPYLDLSARHFRLGLAIHSGDPNEKPGLSLRIVGLEAAQEAIAQEFKAVLGEKLGSGFPLVLGTFKP